MTAAFDQDTRIHVRRLAEEYDDLIRRYADDNGALPESQAAEAAELAHRLRVLYADESDHWGRLSKEHRDGR